MRNYQNITIKIGNICVLGKWEVKPNMENRAREIGFFKKKKKQFSGERMTCGKVLIQNKENENSQQKDINIELTA